MTTTADEKSKLLSYQDVRVEHFNLDHEEDDNEKRVISIYRQTPLILIPMVITAVVYLYSLATRVPAHHHDHTVPTLFSIRQEADATSSNQEGSTFVDSVTNGLYEIMHIAEYKSDLHKNKTDYTIDTDKDIVSFHENITISWTLNDNELKRANKLNLDDDVIALYCPADEADPTKFREAATIAQIRSTNFYNLNEAPFGFRKLIRRAQVFTNKWYVPSFPIIRADTCEVRYWVRNRNDYHSDSMGRQVASFKLGGIKKFRIEHGMAQPTTIHLALTTNPSQMLVQFSTGAEGTPVVAYHQDADVVVGGNLTKGLQFQRGKSTTYKANDMCQEPATVEEPGKFSSPGMLHAVTMSDLEHNSAYYYKVGILIGDKNIDDALNEIVWSEVYSFQSPITRLDAPNSTQPFSFLVYADQGAMGYGNDDGAVRISAWADKEISTNKIRAVHHFGDLSYAQGAAHMWNKWLDMVSVFSTSVPLMVGIGNHEYDHTDGGQDGKDPSGLRSPGGFMPRWGDFGTDSSGECGVPVAKR